MVVVSSAKGWTLPDAHHTTAQYTMLVYQVYVVEPCGKVCVVYGKFILGNKVRGSLPVLYDSVMNKGRWQIKSIM